MTSQKLCNKKKYLIFLKAFQSTAAALLLAAKKEFIVFEYIMESACLMFRVKEVI